MTATEYLLTSLSEEAAEVIYACSKALRFGLRDTHPTRPNHGRVSVRNNLQEIFVEVAHIRETFKRLLKTLSPSDLAEMKQNCDSEGKIMDEKGQAIEKFMEYSRRQGLLRDRDSEDEV